MKAESNQFIWIICSGINSVFCKLIYLHTTIYLPFMYCLFTDDFHMSDHIARNYKMISE